MPVYEHTHSEGDNVYLISVFHSKPEKFKVLAIDERYLCPTLCDYQLSNSQSGIVCVRSDQEEITLFGSQNAAEIALSHYKLQEATKKIKEIGSAQQRVLYLKQKANEDFEKIGISDEENLYKQIEEYTNNPNEQLLSEITDKLKKQLNVR